MKRFMMLAVWLIWVCIASWWFLGGADYAYGGTETGKFETIAIDATVKSLSATCYNPVSGPYQGRQANSATITVDTNRVRFTTDGTAPVATTTGHLLEVGQSVVIEGYMNLKRAKFTKEDLGDGKIQVSYDFKS